ncbi:MAG: PAS domain-containing protein [Candidatus Eiseniibacteriota bacterium]
MDRTAPQIDDPLFLGLYRHWDAKRGNRLYPIWSSFDPLELQPWLGLMSVVEIEAGTGRFKFRIFGQSSASLLNVEMNGRYADELPNYVVDTVLKDYNALVAAGVPIYRVHNVGGASIHALTVRRLLLPLSSNGDDLDMILGAMRFE